MNITFVILAGGVGKRFYPLTTDKTLFPLLGKTVLQHTLEMVERVGGKKVIVSTNAANQDWLSTYKSSLAITTVRQPKPLGMGDALLQVENKIGSEPTIVLNAADLVDDSLLEGLLNKTQDSYAVVVGKEMKDYFPGGYLEVDGNRATSVIEKPGKGNEPSSLVKLVFDYFSEPQTFLSLIKNAQTDNDDQYEVALQQLMQEEVVSFVSYSGTWQALKYSHMVLDWMDGLLSRIKPKIHPTAQIADSAVIEGNVHIAEGAKVFEHAVIKGPAYIGKNAIVATGSLVRESCIEAGANTGFGSEIARSYVGPDCALHHNFVGDSILEAAVNPSYVTRFTNLRLDEKTVSVDYGDTQVDTGKQKMGAVVAKGIFSGVNCTFMPGVTVAEGAQIYPNQVINKAVLATEKVK